MVLPIIAGGKINMFLMPFEDLMLGLLIGAVICAVFAFVIIKLAKKDNAAVAQSVSSFTDAQKEVLMNASLNNCALTAALICSEPKVGKFKTHFRVIFYNLYFPNSINQFQPADVSVPTAQFEKTHLKVGNFVSLQLTPDSAKVIL